MLNKISNKLAVYILVLLVICFSVFTFINYKSTQSIIIEVSENSKKGSAFAMELFVTQYFLSKVEAVENLSTRFEKNPYLMQHRDEVKNALVDAVITSGLNEIAFVYADEDMAFNIVGKKGEAPSVSMESLKEGHNFREDTWYKDAKLL